MFDEAEEASLNKFAIALATDERKARDLGKCTICIKGGHHALTLFIEILNLLLHTTELRTRVRKKIRCSCGEILAGRLYYL